MKLKVGKWNLPPKGGSMDKADGIYLQNMNIAEIRERVKKNDVINAILSPFIGA